MVVPKEILINGIDKTQEVIGFSNAIGLERATSGRHSLLFLAEMFCRTTMSGDIHPYMVLAEIKYLEGIGKPTGTKEASMFRGPYLGGLWHKHHVQAGVSSMAANLQHALKAYGIPALEELAEEVRASGEERCFSLEDLRKITQDAVQGNYERRADAGRLTGEWIVYAKSNGENYYLCLGTHGTEDQLIRQKIESICVHEFTFIGDILTPVHNVNR